jgi:hypothetical protein
MRFFAQLMLVFAVLAYVAMPLNGMATESLAVSGQHPDAMVHMHAIDGYAFAKAVSSDPDCADKHSMFGCGHCAACLTLPAMLISFDARPLVHAAPVPALSHQLLSHNNLPLLPPPRA